ncbi:MAG TPA: methyltransferase domain-containing protein [Actinophytocola sp.]|uniref:class I SAM-dependent methyltransferase n=1 Tax=Actinophytocola sp. TaxID=1872138 RepID=UPI002DDD2F47|nr:methyltransferase domain-containing protein [Actinophytocola sp.]HEV2781503.1 methyltransferase domain-containing protein [Actinophytocola sp.]
MGTDSKTRWQSGLANELEHWRHWLEGGPEAFAGWAFNDYEWRTSPDSDLRQQPHITRHLERFAPPGAEVTILDVGAGPLTCVGKKWPDRTVRVVAVDALADQYDKLLEQLNITPLVRTKAAEVEQLTRVFPANYFDLVYCQNALDHVYDPLRGIHQMLEVVKPEHAVVLMHNVNEGEREEYFGLHQWNFCREQDDFVIWNGDGRTSVNASLAGIAEVRFEDSDPNLLIVSLIKNG